MRVHASESRSGCSSTLGDAASLYAVAPFSQLVLVVGNAVGCHPSLDCCSLEQGPGAVLRRDKRPALRVLRCGLVLCEPIRSPPPHPNSSWRTSWQTPLAPATLLP